MNSIRATGGQIPCLEVVIERSFPVRYVEKEQLDESKTRKVCLHAELVVVVLFVLPKNLGVSK